MLKLDPNPVAADIELARLYIGRDNTAKALTYAQQAIALQPQNLVAHSLIARIYIRQGDIAKANAEIAGIQKSLPTASAGFTLAALAQLAEKQPARAKASYERALQLDPTDIEALEGALRLDMSSGHRQDAAARIAAALARQQPTSDLLMLAGRTRDHRR